MLKEKGDRVELNWVEVDNCHISTMPRSARIHIPGLPLHIVQRGHNRDACFFADEDYIAYLKWLGEALAATGCGLHRYLLMTNHVHLLLTPPYYGLDFVDRGYAAQAFSFPPMQLQPNLEDDHLSRSQT